MVTKVTNDVLANNAVLSNNISEGAITAGKIANGAITSSSIANASINGSKIALGSDAQGDIMYYDGTAWARLPAGTLGQLLTTNGASANPSWSTVTPQFTKSFTSTDQTITAAGLLTLAHGLGVSPKLMRFSLRCTVISAGYAVNDVIEVHPGITTTSTGNAGFAVYTDATNIYIRFGSLATNTIVYPNKTTGVSTLLTNTSWVMIARAWA